MVRRKKGKTAIRKRGPIKPSFAGDQPTPEQQRQRGFAIDPVVSEGQVVGRTYRRQPLYVTLSKTSAELTREELAALDLYRETHDRADRSFTKSCLDFDGDGMPRKPDAILHINKAVRDARETIFRLEAAIGPLLDTLRAVALEDRTFADIAMERFGSRVRDWIEVDAPVMLNGKQVIIDGKPQKRAMFVERLAPKSGRHRERISEEYRLAVTMLTEAIRGHRQNYDIEEVWVGMLASGGAMVCRGPMGPKGAYRLRGNSKAVAATFLDLGRELNGELEYPNHATAKAALASAAVGRLVDVDDLVHSEGPSVV